MGRARNIKHGLWLNEELAELSIYARFLFPCLWCLADKQGRMEYRPRKIKAESYPYDDVDIPALLIELHEKKFISIYGHCDRAYIQIRNWDKHQNPHPKEKASLLPSVDDPLSVLATVGFNEEQEKKLNFTAPPLPSREEQRSTSDLLIPDSNPSDSNPSSSDGKTAKMGMKEFESLYMEAFGKMMSGMVRPDAEDCCKRYPPDRIKESFIKAAENNATSFAYVKAVLEGKLQHKHQKESGSGDRFDEIMRGMR